VLRALERLPGRARRPGRRHHDVPSDHYTRYDPALAREQLARHVAIQSVVGVSLLWGVRSWARLLAALPPRVARALLEVADALARHVPAWADVIVLRGRARGS
jgi:hypothetical protein